MDIHYIGIEKRAKVSRVNLPPKEINLDFHVDSLDLIIEIKLSLLFGGLA